MPTTTDTSTQASAPEPDLPTATDDAPGAEAGVDPGPGTTAGPGPRAPHRVAAAAVMVGGGTAAALGTLAGLWFVPFLVGAVAGCTSRFPRKGPRLSRGYLTAPLAAVLGWALPLAVQALGGAPVAEVARTTAALAGLPPLAGAVVATALLIALVQAVLGVWVGRTLAAPGRSAGDRPATTRPTV
ncbi:hypothetical protein [Streptomyces sp. PR69]|uniref:hypothetical protein n=1 Tax=Streptomyces sp. PR69 TaxID=2984950 RepID=UPI002264B2B5|nr:hypothetical protein [Streptomyces sp. PR69]